ncbi:hypothetical protein BGP_4487 [Beggiatoa sp. PS]|nr:hypothetical protein BGP_4487 [Beggiatoa sp. PS]
MERANLRVRPVKSWKIPIIYGVPTLAHIAPQWEIIRMEKRSRTYDLDGIKEAFKTVEELRMTRTARRTIVGLGFRKMSLISSNHSPIRISINL